MWSRAQVDEGLADGSPGASILRQHQPLCPSGTDSDGWWAQVVASHPGQGWYLLCDGVVLFDDVA